jgi:uroporphyrinogen decarboxylase
VSALIPRAALAESPYLAAIRGLPSTHTPVWFQRQAGRSLPEYRALREGKSFDQMIQDPSLAAEVTLQPVRRHGVDAAIFFSDIITSVSALCPGISIEPNRGPVIQEPFRTRTDVSRLQGFDPVVHVPYVIEAVQRAVAELDPMGVPLIGFAGAPFTVATYLIEGGKSKEFEHTKTLMHGDPETWFALLDALADIALATLRAQVAAGASAVQLFDSWAGILSKAEYREFVLPATSRVFAGLASLDVPRVHFGVGTGELLGLMREAGADAVGVDFRVSLADARERVGAGVPLQGNLDPTIALCAPTVVANAVSRVIDDAAAAGGTHVFNLGHGVLPQTDPRMLTAIVDQVHRATARS